MVAPARLASGDHATHLHASCSKRSRPMPARLTARASAGKSNGVHRAWLDGKLVLDRDDVLFRDDDSVMIEKFLLHSFHGGKSDAFAPPQDQTIWCALARASCDALELNALQPSMACVPAPCTASWPAAHSTSD